MDKYTNQWKRVKSAVQTERTATGIVTTQQERNKKTRQTRWVPIGYVSLLTREVVDEDGKVKTETYADGPYGRALLTA